LKDFAKLRRILSHKAPAAAFAVVTIVLAAAYAVLGNFFILGTMESNPLGIEPVAAVLMVLAAAGSGLLAAAWLYLKRVSPKTCAAGVAGGSVGLLASACPYCPPVLAWLVGAQSLYFLSAYGTVLAAASVALVYWGLHKTLEAV
jgi:hypothetical protein